MNRVTVIALGATIGLIAAGLIALAGMIYLSRDGGSPPTALAAIATLAVQQLVSVVTAYIRSEGGTSNGSTGHKD